MENLFKKTKHLHFIGIGGIGMSGMAELLLNHGFKISGSDLNKSERTIHLSNLGIQIFYDHKSENIKSPDMIIYSSAVDKNNKEITKGINDKIPIIKRSELLGEIIKIKETSVGIAGTHGKTTTSSMLGSILHESNYDPTLIIGGIVNKFNSNNISGNGKVIVVEADEFDRSFLSLKPTHSIINNLDLEHLDCYENIEDLKNTFCKYANSIPFYGKIAINLDSKYLNEITHKINRPKITFGIDNKADINAEIISFTENSSKFKITSEIYNSFTIELNCPGKHNIYNALAATTISLELGVSTDQIIAALKNYSGVKRRFEIKYNNCDIMLVDDYAHHPIEIEFTLNAAKKGWNKRIISIFEPHLYSRTKNFHHDFANALSISDQIIISDIYGAREKPLKSISSELIINDLNKLGFKDCIYIKNKNDIPNYIQKIVQKNDMIILMGAGQINTISNDLIKIFKKNYE